MLKIEITKKEARLLVDALISEWADSGDGTRREADLVRLRAKIEGLLGEGIGSRSAAPIARTE